MAENAPFRGLLRYVPMLTVMGTIFFLSHQPHLPIPDTIEEQDKILHAIAYGVLAATTLFGLSHRITQTISPARGNQGTSPRTCLILNGLGVILFCLLYGISDEIHQSFIPDRHSSMSDVAADSIGAGAVVLIWLYWKMKSFL